jgi:hypothetical protein
VQRVERGRCQPAPHTRSRRDGSAAETSSPRRALCSPRDRDFIDALPQHDDVRRLRRSEIADHFAACSKRSKVAWHGLRGAHQDTGASTTHATKRDVQIPDPRPKAANVPTCD